MNHTLTALLALMTSLLAAPWIILVVEDQEILRMEAVALLQEAGFDTLDAPNADAAIEIMTDRWREVRVLFTDVQMPGSIDGLDLAERVHRSWPNVLLLVTSAGVRMNDEELPDDGRFVPKPYGGSTLIHQIRTLIAKGHGAA